MDQTMDNIRKHLKTMKLSRMERALDEFIIEGIKTTIPFHKKLMRNEDFRKGNFDTSFMNSFKFKDDETSK